MSKVSERIIYRRLSSHLQSFASFPSAQSAYRKVHSVETALLKIQNDLLLAIDKKQVSVLVLLDLTAAFDTVDHNILIERLSLNFGIKDSALSFLQSYISNRTHSVTVDSCTSLPTQLTSGMLRDLS